MALVERDGEYTLRVNGRELMSTRHSYSEAQLGVVACQPLFALDRPCVLVGGLGLGFTLRAALANLGPRARVVVAELLPEVVTWNRHPAYPLAGAELADPRTETVLGDVADVIARCTSRFDAIMLDADKPNDEHEHGGPPRSLRAGRARAGSGCPQAWRHRGLLVGGEEPAFVKRIMASGCAVEVRRVRKHPTAGGHHLLFVCRRD